MRIADENPTFSGSPCQKIFQWSAANASIRIARYQPAPLKPNPSLAIAVADIIRAPVPELAAELERVFSPVIRNVICKLERLIRGGQQRPPMVPAQRDKP